MLRETNRTISQLVPSSVSLRRRKSQLTKKGRDPHCQGLWLKERPKFEPRRFYVLSADTEAHGRTGDCPGCAALRLHQRLDHRGMARHRELPRVRVSRQKIQVQRCWNQKKFSLRQVGHAQHQTSLHQRVEGFDAGGVLSVLGEARREPFKCFARRWSCGHF